MDFVGLATQLLTVATPIVRRIIAEHQAAHDGEMPTDEQVREIFIANADAILAKGVAWTATHPDA